MGSILYYSNHCEYSKKLLQGLSKTNVSKDIHFICIDKRIRDPASNKIYIVLENGNILYGDYIYNSLKKPQEVATQVATQNNMEPVPFAFGNSGYGIVSDQYSFLDMNSEELTAKGSGGMRQMHNYVAIGQMDSINTPAKDDIGSRNTGNMTIEQLQQQREQDLKRR